VAHGIPVHVVAEHPAVALIERLQEDDREGVIGRGGPDVEFRKSPAPDRRFEVRLAGGRHPLRIPDADHARIRRLRVHVVDVRVELLPRDCGGGGEKAAGLLENCDVDLHAERDRAPHLLRLQLEAAISFESAVPLGELPGEHGQHHRDEQADPRQRGWAHAPHVLPS